jgi:hypothetical protein
VLQLLTTDDFAAWFSALDDATAEDVAIALEVVAELGPDRAPPESRESLLWYEHPSVARFDGHPIAWHLEAWGSFRDYARRILAQLEAPRFESRLTRLGPAEANRVLDAVKAIRRASDPRLRWGLTLLGPSSMPTREGADDARAEVRRHYFDALEAAGFAIADVPAHSLALREIARRSPTPAFRLLYGVQSTRETALVVLGERLDRAFYGDSVRRAESTWKQFLAGELPAVQPAELR